MVTVSFVDEDMVNVTMDTAGSSSISSVTTNTTSRKVGLEMHPGLATRNPPLFKG